MLLYILVLIFEYFGKETGERGVELIHDGLRSEVHTDEDPGGSFQIFNPELVTQLIDTFRAGPLELPLKPSVREIRNGFASLNSILVLNFVSGSASIAARRASSYVDRSGPGANAIDPV